MDTADLSNIKTVSDKNISGSDQNILNRFFGGSQTLETADTSGNKSTFSKTFFYAVLITCLIFFVNFFVKTKLSYSEVVNESITYGILFTVLFITIYWIN